MEDIDRIEEKINELQNEVIFNNQLNFRLAFYISVLSILFSFLTFITYDTFKESFNIEPLIICILAWAFFPLILILSIHHLENIARMRLIANPFFKTVPRFQGEIYSVSREAIENELTKIMKKDYNKPKIRKYPKKTTIEFRQYAYFRTVRLLASATLI